MAPPLVPVKLQPRALRPFLSLVDATFRLGDRLVFKGTNWVFGRSQHWAIVGGNGSGKSLFADALRSRLPLVEGDLHYHFQPPAGLSPEEVIGHVSFEARKSEVHGTIVQSRWNSFETEHGASVRDYLSYEKVMDINPFEVSPSSQQARAQFERRLRRAIQLLHLKTLLGRRLLALSNGERQRVELARALCHPLRLLILDEPYLGLDAANRAHFHSVLEHLMCTSVRVLLVTTRIEDLPAHTTHLLQVENCRVVQAAPRRQFQCNDRIIPHGRMRVKRVTKSNVVPATVKRNPLIRLRNVSVHYGVNVILRRLNWTVYEGESWALLGPNGSGKSTLLSLISGDNPQAYGNEVEVFGKTRGNGQSLWELKKEIGWISPEFQLHFDDALTSFDAVLSGFHETIGVFAPPTAAQRAAAHRWLQRFALLEFAGAPLFALSLGLQRMVLLARALVKEPRLLLLDEPCQNLDQVHRELFINTLDHLIRGGCFTAIYVTHRSEEIPPAIKRVKRL